MVDTKLSHVQKQTIVGNKILLNYLVSKDETDRNEKAMVDLVVRQSRVVSVVVQAWHDRVHGVCVTEDLLDENTKYKHLRAELDTCLMEIQSM